MKKIMVFMLVLTMFVGVFSACAAPKGSKGASETAYEHASDEAIFSRVGDWFATRGKSADEKKAILSERKAKRAADKVKKEAEKQQKKAGKEAAKAKKEVKGKMGTMKKGSGK